jgi:hypothetical protein
MTDNIMLLPLKDDISKHDDCSQRIRAQEELLRQARIINELTAERDYWKTMCDGYGR